jgi:hypothetical protein
MVILLESFLGIFKGLKDSFKVITLPFKENLYKFMEFLDSHRFYLLVPFLQGEYFPQ